MLDLPRLQSAYQQVRGELLAERTPDGHWVGELSSSALATATAVSALAAVRAQRTENRGQRTAGNHTPLTTHHSSAELDSLISRGVTYLASQQNRDGGFGDTDLSHSNIATTYLVVAALHLAGAADEHANLLARADAYLESKGRLAGLRERYGIDKTFVVPIMTNLALAGLLDWREIDPLPFELACVPQSWYRFVGMPVVSYAIPALVAIGQARYHHAPPWNPVSRLIRWLSISRSLGVLRRMQPDSGGYLEATPLTSFVVMSLASLAKPRPVVGVNDQTASNRLAGVTPSGSDEADRHATTNSVAPRPMVGALNAPTIGVMNPIADDVIHHGIKFLAASIRPDGSWPIDTNLATWNTTLAINALAGAGEDVAELLGVAVGGAADHGKSVLHWLLSCQHTKRHPFTGADPGGFGWTDLSGAVPDADDTPGALLAIEAWREHREFMLDELESPMRVASVHGVRWLFGLQNRDGGWPTFCRGWGKLPFDRSGADLTAHALRAIAAWSEVVGKRDVVYRLTARSRDLIVLPWEQGMGTHAGMAFLRKKQHPDGSWSPLWFGNQDHPTEDNPVYGTAKVLMAYRDLGLMDSPEAQRGVAWLVANQNEDGGWGSGVWGKAEARDWGLEAREGRVRSAERGTRSGDEAVTKTAASGHSVLGTEYLVPSTNGNAEKHATAQGVDAPRSPVPSSALRVPCLTSSVEETALAAEALLAACTPTSDLRLPTFESAAAAVERGLAWLVDRVEQNQHRQPAPIGFYFAKLWYYERLYPLTFTVAALGRACRQFAHPAPLDSHAQLAPARVP